MKKILSVLFSKNNIKKIENAAIEAKKEIKPSIFLNEIRGELGNFSTIFW